MSAANRLKLLYLAYFSRPAGHRLLYRAIHKRRIRGIVEIGVGDAARTLRMLSVALRHHRPGEIAYTGIDLFESGERGPATTSLKKVHRLLRRTGVRPHLVPGTPYEALARTANSIRHGELVLISHEQTDAALADAWFYVPRLLAAGALIYREELHNGQPKLRPISLLELERLAKPAGRRWAA